MSHDSANHKLNDYLRQSDQVNSLKADIDDHALRSAFRDTIALLRELKLDYALFGALAVSVYVPERRSTMDIDVVTSEKNTRLLLEEAPLRGFHLVSGPSDDQGVLTFKHESGAIVDFICDSLGFADLSHVTSFYFNEIGEVKVADIIDLAYSKLRTQRAAWNRTPEKRLTDRSDLIALLRARPDIYSALRDRFQVSHTIKSSEETQPVTLLDQIVGEAGIQVSETWSRIPVHSPWQAILFNGLVIFLITGAIISFLLLFK